MSIIPAFCPGCVLGFRFSFLLQLTCTVYFAWSWASTVVTVVSLLARMSSTKNFILYQVGKYCQTAISRKV